MKIALAILGLYLPVPVRKRVLRNLFTATARAFGVDPPPTKGLSTRRLLRAYALFTKKESEKVWAECRDQSSVERRLFQYASELGAILRLKFGVRSRNDVISLSRMVYRILGISFKGRTDGQIIISSCYFSRFYTGRVCRLISALDAGAAAGISGGGKLEFIQRITEGHDSCRARLLFEDGPS